MPISREDAARFRDRLHNLDIEKPEHQAFLEQQVYRFFVGNEDKSNYAYDDGIKRKPRISKNRKIEGNVTIGVGFNMSRGEAEDEWNRAFKGTLSFDAAISGKLTLTDQENDLFSVGHPGSAYNCRCIAEPVPANVQVIEEGSEMKHMRLTSLELGCMITDWKALQRGRVQMLL